jgi:hypothetical protein
MTPAEKIDNPLTHDRSEMYEFMQEFYNFLQGEAPETISVKDDRMPKLTPDQAFAVIWYLQEHMGVLPDCMEQCNDCGDVFNQDCDGGYIEFPNNDGPNGQQDGSFCEDCYDRWESSEQS